MSKPVLLFANCLNPGEAEEIARELLSKKAIDSLQYLPATSPYLWGYSLNNIVEMLLIIKTTEENIPNVEKEIEKIRKAKKFMCDKEVEIVAIPIIYSSKKSIKDEVL